jgi:tetratricopeptide (TPR) repeat protein
MIKRAFGILLGLAILGPPETAAADGIAGAGRIQAQGTARVWEEKLVLPTYRVEPAEPNPIFFTGRAYQGAKGPVYPYPFLDRLTDTKEDKSYRAVYLENEYLKVCVLPEIGGRIFSAVDKTNGYDFVYRQHVIKPALIGMLGAWISGGVEWNIPHHHRATTYLTVDHLLARNPDGSVTAWVGEIELRHRTKWLVGLTLRPGSAVLEVTTRLLNRTPLAHSQLAFANVAIHADPDYQVIFPPDVEIATFHGKNQFSHWPISRETFNGQDYTAGVDVSWWKSHSRPTSFFAFEARGDFLAGYDHRRQAGVAFVGDHHFVPGKKLWTWGTGSEGKLWESILTDSDGPYAELMIGAFSDNQPDYSWAQPYETREATQYWYPIRGIGGVKAAGADAAANLELSGEKIRVGIQATRALAAARIVVRSGDRIVLDETASLDPGRPFLRESPAPAGAAEGDVDLKIYAADGRVLLAYVPPKKNNPPLPSPVTPPAPPEDVPTIEELYLTGLRLEQFYNPAVEPYPYYEEALRRDPGDYRVNTALGVLYLKRALHEKAAAHLAAAVERATKNYTRPKDGEAYYYLGLALRALHRDSEAEDSFFRAAWSQAWQAASNFQLAEMSARRADFPQALARVSSSLAMNARNTTALGLKAALLRRLGRLPEAERTSAEALAVDPMDFRALNETLLANTASGLREDAGYVYANLAAALRDAPANHLELAAEYAGAGLWDEASQVLSRPVEAKLGGVGEFPLVHYFLGYCLAQKGEGEKADEAARRAASLSPDYVFPFQSESLDVLGWARTVNPRDARAPYYLGNFLFDLQPEAAFAAWESSVALDGGFSVAHRNLAQALARVKNDVAGAAAELEKAVAGAPGDPKLYFELDRLYEAAGAAPEKRLALLEKNQATVAKRDDTLTREIQLLVQLGRYDRAIELLGSRHFHVWEGGGEIYGIFVEARLLRGRRLLKAGKAEPALADFEAALTYPSNLDVAAPSSGGGSAKVLYFIGLAREALNDANGAKAAYEKALSFRHGWSEPSFYRGLAARKLGREDEAAAAFEGLLGFARERLKAAPAMDFFEKFGEKESALRLQAQAHFLAGLGHFGLGKKAEAEAEFRKALELNPNHVGAARELGQDAPKRVK